MNSHRLPCHLVSRAVALSCLVLAVLLLPAGVEAKTLAEWSFGNEAALDDWRFAGIEEGKLVSSGVQLAVHGTVVAYRTLPEGLRLRMETLEIRLQPSTLASAKILLLEIDSEGKVGEKIELPISFEKGQKVEKTISLYPYRQDLWRCNTLAVSLEGESEDVIFGGIRFLSLAPLERLIGAWRSFWTLEPFGPHTINLLLGPIVIPDIGRQGRLDPSTFVFGTSANAYFLVALSVFACGVLFWGLRTARRMHPSWPALRRHMTLLILSGIVVVWGIIDCRMGAEFLAGVREDFVQYVFAEPPQRVFRDRERFYDFASFVREHVADRPFYEVLLAEQWPYAGTLLYTTYPILPNLEKPVSDTWVIYMRPDIVVDDSRRLALKGNPFTRPGTLLGRFDDTSFIFREDPQ